MADAETVGTASEDYDAAHGGVHASPLMRELWSQAMGDQYPVEVEPFSSCSWWLLGQLVAALRPRPGGLLVDFGCGRGGPGLWLARALAVRLIGIDFSAVAVELAASRADGFVGPGRAEFRHSTFERTGLPDGCADAAVSVDALPFAEDRVAALREVRRVLASGGRIAMTARQPRPGTVDWQTMAASAGLELEQSLVNPHHDEHWRRLYALWLAHEPQLRAEVGERAADNFMREAAQGDSQLVDRPPLLLVMRRPADPSTPPQEPPAA